MKRCKNICDEWDLKSEFYFGEDKWGNFCLTNAYDNGGRLNNYNVAFCPWCGAELIESDKEETPIDHLLQISGRSGIEKAAWEYINTTLNKLSKDKPCQNQGLHQIQTK